MVIDNNILLDPCLDIPIMSRVRIHMDKWSIQISVQDLNQIRKNNKEYTVYINYVTNN
jgi:hypothetical protein